MDARYRIGDRVRVTVEPQAPLGYVRRIRYPAGGPMYEVRDGLSREADLIGTFFAGELAPARPAGGRH